MAENEVIHPYDHVFFNREAVHNELDVAAVIMTQISLKSGLKKWGENVICAFHSEMKQLHTRVTLISIHRKDLT